MLLFLLQELLKSKTIKELEKISDYQKLEEIELTKQEEQEFLEAYQKRKKEIENLSNNNDRFMCR
jgi:hypothetical protein